MKRVLDLLGLRGHGAEHRRAQRLALLTLTVFAWCMAYATTQLLLDHREAAMTSLMMAGLTLSWPALLAVGRPRIAAHWACTCLAVFGAFRAVGDVHPSSAGALLAMTPLIAALLFERREALLWLGVAAFGLGLLGASPSDVVPVTDPHHLVDTAGAILATWLLLSASDQHARLAENELTGLHHALGDARQRADDAHAARERLLAEMNQEIRGPLNVVVGMSSLLLETPLDRSQQQYAQAIYRSGRSLGEVVDNVLDYDAVQRGDLALDVAPLGLRSLVADVLQSHAPSARAQGLLLEGVVEPEVHDILKGDGPRLRQVLMNLVGNALKFTEAGSVVLRVGQRDDRTRFAVHDTGPGIPADAQRRLFLAFEQADGSTTRRFGGTGLGLTISQSLVGLMGGELQLNSTLGEGSTFHFDLQLNAIEVPVPHRLVGRRVLLVEPRPLCREALRAALERTGARVFEADSASAAASLLQRAHAEGKPCDVAIVATELHDLEAGVFAALLAADDRLCELPLVQIAELDDTSHGDDAGFSATVARPFQPAALGDAVAHALHVPTTARSTYDDTITGRRARLPVLPGQVLVIELDPAQRELAQRSLEGMVDAVEVAGSHDQAIAATMKSAPALVLIDLHQSHVEDLVSELRRHLNPGTPLVGLAALRSPEVEEQGRALRLSDVLVKPIRASTLRRVLERHLDVRAA